VNVGHWTERIPFIGLGLLILGHIYSITLILRPRISFIHQPMQHISPFPLNKRLWFRSHLPFLVVYKQWQISLIHGDGRSKPLHCMTLLADFAWPVYKMEKIWQVFKLWWLHITSLLYYNYNYYFAKKSSITKICAN